MVMLAQTPVKNVESGAHVKFLQDNPDLGILQGDVGVIERRQAAGIRGRSTPTMFFVKFDDGVTVELTPNTRVRVIQQSPAKAERALKRKESTRQAVKGLVQTGRETVQVAKKFGKETVEAGKGFGPLLGIGGTPKKKGKQPKGFIDPLTRKATVNRLLDAWWNKSQRQFNEFHNMASGDGKVMLEFLRDEKPSAYQTLWRSIGGK